MLTDENGWFVGPKGGTYRHEWEAYSIEVLRMCGCGQPALAYNFLRGVLACFDRRQARGGRPWINAEESIAALIAASPDTAAHVLY